MAGRAPSFLDLPNELLIRISQDAGLSPRDLLSLATTSKRLLRLTIPTYLRRYDVPGPCDALDISGRRTAPVLHGLALSPHLAPARRLRCALTSGRAAVRETRALARVAALLDHVREVEVDLGEASCPPGAAGEWAALLGALLGELVRGGKCERLGVRRGGYVRAGGGGGGEVPALWDAGADCVVRMVEGMRELDDFEHGARSRLEGSERRGALTELTIHHAPFLAQAAFAPFLRAALTCPTLTSLTFDTLSLTDPAWEAVLDHFRPPSPRLHLPALEQLTLRACVVRFATLVDLVTAHARTLAAVDITATTHPYGDAAALRPRAAPLPRLRALTGVPVASPAFAEALLGGRLLALPALAHLGLQVAFGAGAEGAAVDRVLDALARGGVRPVGVALALAGRAGAVAWMQAVAAQAQGPRARRLPVCAFVGRLEVTLVGFAVGEHVLRRVLPHWLALFPGVEDLTVEVEEVADDRGGVGEDDEGEGEVDVGKVAQAIRAAGRCPGLKRLTVGVLSVEMEGSN